MHAQNFDTLVSTVLGAEPPRVWSLLVTVFGDLAQDPGARIAGTTLSRIGDLVGLKPQAMRVALHRLRRDGWIVSHRSGRTTDYALTDAGRRESAAASPRIYGLAAPPSEAWLMVTEPDAQTTADCPAGAVALGPGLWLLSQPIEAPGALVFALCEETPVPAWIRARVCGDELCAMAATLYQRLSTVPDGLSLSPLETAALRVMLVHEWRRIALRLPALPDHLFPEAAQITPCRARMQALLRQLPRPTLQDLQAAPVS